MEAVNDLKHFSDLVKVVRRHSGDFVSNCYLLPADIQQYTQNNKMFWEGDSSGIYFFYEQDDFYQLFFYQDKQTEIRLSEKNKPVMIDLVYRDSQSAPLLEMEEKWVISGFVRYKSFERMSRETLNNEIGAFPLDFVGNANYQIAFAQRAHKDEIETLWKNTLDRFSNALPSGEKIYNLVDNQQILCALDRDQHIAAALQFKSKNSVCTIEHVAVDERHRRRGLAKLLLQFCFSEGGDIKRHILWVENTNLAAIQLYRGLRFQFDGMVSRQLLKS